MSFDNLHPALREIRGFLAQPKVVAALCGTAVLATLAQPFGFRIPGHIGLTLIYWLLVIWITFPLGYAISIVIERRFEGRPRWIAASLAALTMGVLTTAIVYILNAVFLAWGIFDLPKWMMLISTTFPTASLVTLVVGITMGPALGEQKPGIPPLLARIPFDQRGNILHLSAQDHYTEVSTTKGNTLVLIRFADAVIEAAPTIGLQTHRSHWVAVAAMVSAKRQGDGAILTLSNGTRVPVSRSRMPDIRKAGFL